MTQSPPIRNPTLPPEVALRCDEVCDGFEAAWKTGMQL